MSMTPEDKAIKALELAFKRCADLEIEFAGMDDNLLYATSDCLKNTREKKRGNGGDYCSVARAAQMCDPGSGTINTHKAYQDSGGY